ncbi:hypothetical protein XELAEV_18001840mg [Xenopus laevis]|nr:hypothetical protein XELAEV_18001840mg [Xenopus laevis]
MGTDSNYLLSVFIICLTSCCFLTPEAVHLYSASVRLAFQYSHRGKKGGAIFIAVWVWPKPVLNFPIRAQCSARVNNGLLALFPPSLVI